MGMYREFQIVRMRADPPKGKMMIKAPKFGRAGTELHSWICRQFDIGGTEPLVDHLCDLQDLMETLKADISKRGAVLQDGRRNPSVDASLKASAAFARAWRILGLADVAKEPKTNGRKP